MKFFIQSDKNIGVNHAYYLIKSMTLSKIPAVKPSVASVKSTLDNFKNFFKQKYIPINLVY